MKNIEQLKQLIKTHKIYFNCDNVNILSKYLKSLAYDQERMIPNTHNDIHDKILIISYLVSIEDIETEIIFSNDYKVNDFRLEGALNNAPCVAAFIRCNGTKLESELQKLKQILSL